MDDIVYKFTQEERPTGSCKSKVSSGGELINISMNFGRELLFSNPTHPPLLLTLPVIIISNDFLCGFTANYPVYILSLSAKPPTTASRITFSNNDPPSHSRQSHLSSKFGVSLRAYFRSVIFVNSVDHRVVSGLILWKRNEDPRGNGKRYKFVSSGHLNRTKLLLWDNALRLCFSLLVCTVHRHHRITTPPLIHYVGNERCGAATTTK